jgi:hypothetical protein
MLRARLVPRVNSGHAGELKVKAMVRARSDEEGCSERHLLCLARSAHRFPFVEHISSGPANIHGTRARDLTRTGQSTPVPTSTKITYHIYIHTGHKMMIKYIELNFALKPGNTPRQPISIHSLCLFICLVT